MAVLDNDDIQQGLESLLLAALDKTAGQYSFLVKAQGTGVSVALDTNTSNSIQWENWPLEIGNYLEYEYYTDTGGGKNPSGTTTNLRYLKLVKSGGTTQVQYEYSYNSVDDIIKKEMITPT